MINFFVLIAAIIGLIIIASLLFFVYRIYKRNDAIDKIHYLISENNKSINKSEKKMNDIHTIMTMYKFEKIIEDTVEK